jgi:uncharacterized protein YkwD
MCPVLLKHIPLVVEKMNKKNLSVAVVSAFMLAACGSGGGSSAAAATTPAAGASTLASAVATPTYPPSSGPLAAFNTLNAYRLSMGVGEVAQAATLDTAAQAHAAYVSTNLAAGTIAALTHNEVTTNPGYYGLTPLSRAQTAGAPATEWIGEDLGDSQLTDAVSVGTDCVNRLLDSVYHLAGLTDPQTTVGIGFTPVTSQVGIAICNLDFGSTASGTPEANAIPSYGGQQMASTSIAHVPLSNETGVAVQMAAETPNPAPDITSPGRPLMVRVRADAAGDVLTVASFTLTDASGNIVNTRILIPSGAQTGSSNSAVVDPNGLLGPGTVALLPLQPLTASTTYTATFSGARDGTPISATWTFTTTAAAS